MTGGCYCDHSAWANYRAGKFDVSTAPDYRRILTGRWQAQCNQASDRLRAPPFLCTDRGQASWIVLSGSSACLCCLKELWVFDFLISACQDVIIFELQKVILNCLTTTEVS